MKIVFMGTPDIAASCLEALLKAGHEVVGVFTQPDKPQGRGNKLMHTPVKAVALAHNIPVFQPHKLRGNTEMLGALKALAPEMTVVVAYGQILPQAFLDVAVLGSINLHASLLPKLRGAAPIQRAIIEGDLVTGVTTMYMAAGLDTGDMLETISTPIDPDETSGALFLRIAQIGADCLLTTLEKAKMGTLKPVPQQEDTATWASVLTKEDGHIDFKRTSLEIHNQIRGCNPWPLAFTKFSDKKLKVYHAKIGELCGTPGELLDNKKLIIGTKDGSIEFLEVVLEGGKRNTGSEFINGKRLSRGQIFE